MDFILGHDVAIEVKISQVVYQQDLKGLIAFCEEHPKTLPIVISLDERKRSLKINNELTITIFPWKVFLKQLWEDKIF